jgi:anti-sigma B factor antagonist
MDFKTEKIGDVTVVVLKTEVIDANNAREFRRDIAPILEQNNKLAFDLSQIGFLDSSGCGTLLSCLRQVTKSDGDLKLFAVQKPVLSLFELVRMHRIIEIFNTREEAVKSF